MFKTFFIEARQLENLEEMFYVLLIVECGLNNCIELITKSPLKKDKRYILVFSILGLGSHGFTTM